MQVRDQYYQKEFWLRMLRMNIVTQENAWKVGVDIILELLYNLYN